MYTMDLNPEQVSKTVDPARQAISKLKGTRQSLQYNGAGLRLPAMASAIATSVTVSEP
jgi:hypothetical protein